MARDVDEIPEGIDPDLHITFPTYCGKCGHNLLYARRVGLCNECGQPYNARSLFRTGIFNPGDYRVPISDTIVTLLCYTLAFIAIKGQLNPVHWNRVALCAVALIFAILYTRVCIKNYVGLYRSHQILRRIHQDRD